MKKLISKRKLNSYKKKGLKLVKKNAIPSALMVALVVGVLAYKKPLKAYYYDDGGSTGRGALLGGLTGAAIGGAAGGGRGAAIGGVAGLGLGALIGSRRGGSDPYRKLDRLERRLGKLQNKAAEYRDLMKSASYEKKRQRYARRLSKVERDIANRNREINRMKQNLGVRK